MVRWWFGHQVPIDYIFVYKLSDKQIGQVTCRCNECLINLLIDFRNRGYDQGQYKRMLASCHTATAGAHFTATGYLDLAAGHVTLFPGKKRGAIDAQYKGCDQN